MSAKSFETESLKELYLASLGFSGCGQAVTTCNKVFYKVVVIHAFSLATRLSGPITF